MKTQFITLIIFVIGLSAQSQTTAIPDPHFEQALIDLGIDSDGELNGQILTADAEQVTNLYITTPDDGSVSYPDDFIQDLTGLEAFVNVDTLRINWTVVEELNLSTLTQLRYLDVNDNMLTWLDVSNNPLLEHLRMYGVGEIEPYNNFSEIDLSNNPNIHTLDAPGIRQINLKNGNNLENTTLIIYCPGTGCMDRPEDYLWANVCIIVDDAEGALNDELPYSTWDIINFIHVDYHFVDNPIDCTASDTLFDKSLIKIYPNPTKDIVYFDLPETIQINKAEIIDYTGKVVQTEENITQNISVKRLATGTYILRLSTNKGLYKQKLIIR